MFLFLVSCCCCCCCCFIYILCRWHNEGKTQCPFYCLFSILFILLRYCHKFNLILPFRIDSSLRIRIRCSLLCSMARYSTAVARNMLIWITVNQTQMIRSGWATPIGPRIVVKRPLTNLHSPHCRCARSEDTHTHDRKRKKKKTHIQKKINDVFDVTINVRPKPARHHIGAGEKKT